jgi:hypothetical protein
MEAESTSFIPKSAFAKSGQKTFYKEAGVGFIFKISAFLFLVSLLSFGGSFLYKNNLAQEIELQSEPLERAKSAFDAAIISELESLVATLEVAEKLVNQHVFPSRIFTLLESLTYKDVRFTQFDYSYSPPKEDDSGTSAIKQNVNLGPVFDLVFRGEAKSYMALAKQAEVFKNSSEVIDATFSDFTLTSQGYISFALRLIVNPSILSYD